jgi:hypothetical protein
MTESRLRCCWRRGPFDVPDEARADAFRVMAKALTRANVDAKRAGDMLADAAKATLIVVCAAAWLPVGALLAACGGAATPPAPPQPSGPTFGERSMYQAGYKDGRQREAGAAQFALRTKDAELDTMRSRLAHVEREAVAAKASDSTALQSCETELQQAREQLVQAESRSSVPTTPAVSNSRDSGSDRHEAPGSTPCCRVCHTGKACGNSCISRSKQCHKGRGCACDG